MEWPVVRGARQWPLSDPPWDPGRHTDCWGRAAAGQTRRGAGYTEMKAHDVAAAVAK